MRAASQQPDDLDRDVVNRYSLNFPAPAPEKIRSEKPQRANDQAGHISRYSYGSILEPGRLIIGRFVGG
jgi:hypothetical protein